MMRYIRGLPTELGLDAAERGELYLGGCMGKGFPPRWVIVW